MKSHITPKKPQKKEEQNSKQKQSIKKTLVLLLWRLNVDWQPDRTCLISWRDHITEHVFDHAVLLIL